MTNRDRLRLKVRSMLNLSAPADALAAYYVFYHDPERAQLYVHENAAGHADGFVAVCQTAQRLFQPTVVLRTPNTEVAIKLLRQALISGRPYYVITTPDLRGAVSEVVRIERPQNNRIYDLDMHRFQFLPNVLVVADDGLEDRPRFVIRSQGEIVAEAGLTWHSPHFAAVYVSAKAAARRREWDQSVMAACTRWVIRSGRRALCIVDKEDETYTVLAERIGYVDTGAREFVCEVVCR